MVAVPATSRLRRRDSRSGRRAIVEFNRYRVKNGTQLWNEGREIEAIEAERARARMVAGKTPDPTDNWPEGNAAETRAKVADAIGLGSGRQWDRLRVVGEGATGDPNRPSEHPANFWGK